MQNHIVHIRVPLLGRFAICRDNGQAVTPGGLLLVTRLTARHIRNARTLRTYDLGSGLVTVVGVNKLVSDAVAGTGTTLANFKYFDSGLGTTAATDGDSALQTAITTGPSRVISTLSNAQSATTGNHTAKLQYQGTITYNTGMTYPGAVTEWGLFDASSSGNMFDHKVFSAINVNNGDSIQFTYTLSLPSNN